MEINNGIIIDGVLYESSEGFCNECSLYRECCNILENYWTYDILTIPRHDLIGLSDRPIIRYNTYEEALEAGLQEALKLI